MERSVHFLDEQQPTSSELEKSDGVDMEYISAAMQYMDPGFREWLQKQMSNSTSENVSSKTSNYSLPHVNCVGIYKRDLDEFGKLRNTPNRVPAFLPRSILKNTSRPASRIQEIKEISSSEEDSNINVVHVNDEGDQDLIDKISKTNHWDICEEKRKESDLASKKTALEKSILYSAKAVEQLLTNVSPTNWNWRDSDSPSAVPISKPSPQNVLEISHEPIYCPHCDTFISPSSVMYHFLMQHVRNEEIFFVQIHLKQRCLFVFEPLQFEFRKNFALSLFAYGGVKTSSNIGAPICRGIALPNSPLPPQFKSFQNYSPIILMACRTSWAATFGSLELDEKLSAVHIEKNDLWVFWLVSTEMIKPLYATITVFNRLMDQSLSRVVKVRKLTDSQKCYDFLKSDCNRLDLSFNGVKSMSRDFTWPITLEILFNERL